MSNRTKWSCPYCDKVEICETSGAAWHELESHLIRRHPKIAFDNLLPALTRSHKNVIIRRHRSFWSGCLKKTYDQKTSDELELMREAIQNREVSVSEKINLIDSLADLLLRPDTQDRARHYDGLWKILENKKTGIDIKDAILLALGKNYLYLFEKDRQRLAEMIEERLASKKLDRNKWRKMVNIQNRHHWAIKKW